MISLTTGRPTYILYNKIDDTWERRQVIPIELEFGEPPGHQTDKPLWILRTYDLDKRNYRSFPLSKIVPENA